MLVVASYRGPLRLCKCEILRVGGRQLFVFTEELGSGNGTAGRSSEIRTEEKKPRRLFWLGYLGSGPALLDIFETSRAIHGMVILREYACSRSAHGSRGPIRNWSMEGVDQRSRDGLPSPS